MQYIENKTFDQIKVGDCAQITRTLNQQDIELFAVMSGDVNPAHVDPEYAQSDMFHKVIAHGMWGGALISAVLGTELPGPGTIYLNQSLSFRRPVGLGETVTVCVTVTKKFEDKKRLMMNCLCTNAAGETVITGEAEVIAPTEKVRRPRVLLPEVHLHERGVLYSKLIAATRPYSAIRTAVVHPCDEVSLAAALSARELGLIEPVLVGPKDRMTSTAVHAGLNIDGLEIIDTPHSHASAEQAVVLARGAKVHALMKGALHTDELMSAVISHSSGLRTERRMSHVYALDVPHYAKPLFITDAAINIEPDLMVKRDIIQNAIDLVRTLGIEQPKVAILSAVETVSLSIRSSVDAAALCKMTDRGQITGALVDGPLAFDNAISIKAAQAKNISSSVAGDADILLAPDLVSANMLAKQLIFLAGAEAAGIVMGAQVPIVLTSRADDTPTRVASCALAKLFSHHSLKTAVAASAA